MLAAQLDSVLAAARHMPIVGRHEATTAAPPQVEVVLALALLPAQVLAPATVRQRVIARKSTLALALPLVTPREQRLVRLRVRAWVMAIELVGTRLRLHQPTA